MNTDIFRFDSILFMLRISNYTLDCSVNTHYLIFIIGAQSGSW